MLESKTSQPKAVTCLTPKKSFTRTEFKLPGRPLE